MQPNVVSGMVTGPFWPLAPALAPDLAVGDDVDAGALHVADGEQRGVVLRPTLIGARPMSKAQHSVRARGRVRRAVRLPMSSKRAH
jgi:hypothetical protein